MKKVYFNSVRCLACRSCELACAVEHSQGKDPLTAHREEPVPIPRRNVRLADGKLLTTSCRHCAKAPCAEACIAGAITRNPQTGHVECDGDKCICCWMCVMACPFDAIKPGKLFSIKCDMCAERGSPSCVDACPTKALFEATPEEFRQAAAAKRPPKKDEVLR